MQIEVQRYLDLVEQANTLAFYDIESTGFHGDYNSILVISVKPFKSKPVSFVVKQPGNDQRIVREAKEYLQTFDCIVGFYSKGFDWNMINTRLMKWNQEPINPIHHIDMYFSLKGKLNLSRKSQASFAGFLKAEEQKMGVSAHVWSDAIAEPVKNLPVLKQRCESDVISLQNIYEKTRHLIRDIKVHG